MRGEDAEPDPKDQEDEGALFPVGGTTSNFAFPVPLNAGFVGLDVYFQAASLDSSAAGGVVVSNGLAATLGY